MFSYVSFLVLLVGFNESIIEINEAGGSGEVMACVVVVSAVLLETDVSVTVFTVDDTAQGT